MSPTKDDDKTEKRKRNRLIQCRCDDAEYAQAKRLADRAGFTLGAYTRACVLGSPGPRAQRLPTTNKKELIRLLGELGKNGSNLNQLARAVNSGQIPRVKAIERACEAFSDMRADVRRALGLGEDDA